MNYTITGTRVKSSLKTAVCYICLMWTGLGPAGLQAQRSGDDSLAIRIKPMEVAVPVALGAAGLITQGKISRHLQREIVGRYPGFHTNADDFVIFAPAAVSLGLSAAGVKGKHSLGEQILLTVVCNIISQGVTQSLKLISKYPRPDGDGYDAFPSGHTTIAFTNAALLHQEYGHRSYWYPIGGYTAATAAGAMRMLNNRHWLADVLFGSGVGIGSTHGVYAVYPWAKGKLLSRKKR